jgi:hypothetical protein
MLTPTAFRLIAQGCVATLGKVTPSPNYAEGVAQLKVECPERLIRDSALVVQITVQNKHALRALILGGDDNRQAAELRWVTTAAFFSTR